ncbi:MAG: hypothetical protein QNK23_12605 [Crocinitomicaceae bacterium]|nr:hypothetical protein [Crocinitomicaceae bacterium]
MSFRKQKEISGHAAAVYTCIAQNDHIYSGSADKHVARWLIDEGIQDKFAIRFEQSIYALEFIGKEVLAVGLADGGLHFFNLETKEELKFFVQHTKGIFSIRYNATKGQIYVGDADGNLSVWSDQLELIIYLPLDCGKIRSIDVSGSGEHFVLACQDETIRIFETEHFNELHTMVAHENGATSVLFHPTNMDQLITGGKDALLKLWNWKSEELLKTIVAHTFSIYEIISMDNGNRVVTASRDKNVKVWDSNLEFIKRLDFKEGGHRHSVNALAKLNEKEFVSCSDDKKLIVWEMV